MYEHLQASPPGLAVLRQLAEEGCTSIEATEYFVRFTKGLSFSDVASLKGDQKPTQKHKERFSHISMQAGKTGTV